MTKINGLEFSIGADPEFFVARGGKPVSAFGLVPGDKKAPFKVRNGAVQVDGMALEFNIDPVQDEAGFIRNLNDVMDQIMQMVPGYTYYDRPVAEFGADYIRAQPDEAKILGCEPDYNAYTAQVNPRPNGDAPFRTAAGHIHIGWTKDVNPLDPGHFKACCTLTKMLDVTLGLPSLLWDDDQKRRELYGQAGAFRPKSYGMEYRTLSNRWLRPDLPHLPKAIYANTIKAIKDCFENEDKWKIDVRGKTAQEIINAGDVESAFWAGKYLNHYLPPSQFRQAAPAAAPEPLEAF